jgi:hypothetical protein
VEIIDVWAQVPTERFMAQPWLEALLRWTRQDRTRARTDTTVTAMDAAGLARALLCAWSSPDGMLIGIARVAAAVATHPDRSTGVASFGPPTASTYAASPRTHRPDSRSASIRDSF